MTLERRMQALLDLVDGDRCAQCDIILDEARASAAALDAQARADARARVREVFIDERRRAHERVAAASARLQTKRRLHEQQRAATMLALGWQRLPDVLRQRWSDADARRVWVDAVADSARHAMPRTCWNIAHAADWPAGEQQALAARLEAECGAAPQFAADSSIAAGLRIAAGGNVVDGTLAGLMADRAEVGAQLLRYLEETA